MNLITTMIHYRKRSGCRRKPTKSSSFCCGVTIALTKLLPAHDIQVTVLALQQGPADPEVLQPSHVLELNQHFSLICKKNRAVITLQLMLFVIQN